MSKQNYVPRGYRNNNPCNIRKTQGKAWVGEVQPSLDPAFKQFRTMAYGFRAAMMLIRNYGKRYHCRTIKDIINRWAPPTAAARPRAARPRRPKDGRQESDGRASGSRTAADDERQRRDNTDRNRTAAMKILIDNGHGENTQGKRSPDGVLREYAYAREIAEAVVRGLVVRGYDAERIVREASDVSLTERTRRVNDTCKSVGRKNVLLVSIHCNAAGNGSAWMNARGWSAHVSDNASAASKRLALSLIKAAEAAGLKVRKYSKRTPYWAQNLAICRDTHCPAVLTENLFQDNREDVAFLLSGEGRKAIAGLHVQGIIDYISNL